VSSQAASTEVCSSAGTSRAEHSRLVSAVNKARSIGNPLRVALG